MTASLFEEIFLWWSATHFSNIWSAQEALADEIRKIVFNSFLQGSSKIKLFFFKE